MKTQQTNVVQQATFVEWFHTLSASDRARVISDKVAGRSIDRTRYGKAKPRLLRGGRPNWLAPDAIIRAEVIQQSRTHDRWS